MSPSAAAAEPVTSLRRARVAVTVAFGAQGLLFATLLTHLPQFRDRFGLADTQVSLVILLVCVAAAAGSIAAERVAARGSSRTALRVGLATIAIAAVLIALSSDRTVFVAAFAVYGLGLGAVDAASNMQAVAVQHAAGRSILTSFHAAWSTAGIVGALWVALGERIGIDVGVSVAVAAAAVVLGAGLTTRSLVHDAPVVGAGSTGAPARLVLLLGAAMACFYVVDGAVSNWSAIYLRDLLHASASTAAVGYAAYQGTSVVARLSGDHLVRRAGRVTTVRAAATVGVVGLLAVVFAPGPAVAVVGFGVVGLALPVVAPLCFSAAGALAPGRSDALVARVNVFNYVGAVVGGVSVGLVGSLRVGFALPLLLAAALWPLARAFAPGPAAGDAEAVRAAAP